LKANRAAEKRVRASRCITTPGNVSEECISPAGVLTTRACAKERVTKTGCVELSGARAEEGIGIARRICGAGPFAEKGVREAGRIGVPGRRAEEGIAVGRVVNASTEHELDSAFASLLQQGASVLFVANEPFFENRRDELIVPSCPAESIMTGVPTFTVVSPKMLPIKQLLLTLSPLMPMQIT
jgi:hypothetical protein